MQKIATVGVLAMLSLMLPLAAAAQSGRVSVCHVPPDDPRNAHVISVSETAVDAHLNHGDIVTDNQEVCTSYGQFVFVGPTENSVAVFALLSAGWAAVMLYRRSRRSLTAQA
jgi:hypothetical protein